jgi:23S rRNA pseudouridine2605 synthase
MPLERLQKIIAASGVASRRKAEELITSGLVSVNGKLITELGAKADPENDNIKVRGKLLRGPERHVYLIINKPRGYMTTVSDPEGRPTVMELVPREHARLYPVGRLDYQTEGLLLMTNDGDLAYKLMQASSHVPKTYLVKVSGEPDQPSIERLRKGVSISQGWEPGRRTRTAPARIRIIKEAANPWYEITLTEGKNRQLRKMFEEIGHHVEKIRRVSYGPLTLDVPAGESRRLTESEVRRLKKSVARQSNSKPQHGLQSSKRLARSRRS